MTDERKSQQRWWQTLPGILTATAAVITAISGLLALLFQYGVIGERGFSGFGRDPGDAERHPNIPDRSAKAPNTPKPWSNSDAALTTRNGVTTIVRADTLSNCISVNHGLTPDTGQSIPFEKMQRFEVLSAEQLYAPNAKATLTITLLDGTQMRGISVAANCDLFGYNDLGRFATHLQDLRRVEFRR